MIDQFITHMYSFYFGEVELTISVNKEAVPTVKAESVGYAYNLSFWGEMLETTEKLLNELTDTQFKIVVSMVNKNPKLYDRLKIYFS